MLKILKEAFYLAMTVHFTGHGVESSHYPFYFSHGFVLPKDEIIPSGEEMWAGFQVVINRLLSLEK